LPDLKKIKKRIGNKLEHGQEIVKTGVSSKLKKVSERKSVLYKKLEPHLLKLYKRIEPAVEFCKTKYEWFSINVLKSGELKNHILIKYLFKDLFLYFLVAFLFFFMIFFVNQILLTVEQLLAKSAPFSDVMRIMFYSLPFIIAQSAPFATLVGFSMSLGGMMSSNEILIFRASGISFIKIFYPVMILGAAISIGSFFVNDYLLPLGTMKYNQLFRKIMQSTPAVSLESNSVKSLDSASIVMGDVNEGKVTDLILFDSDDDSEKIIVAGESSLGGGSINGVLMQLSMSDAVVLSISKKTKHDYDIMESEKTVLNVFDKSVLGNTTHSAREMTTYDLSRELKQMKENLGDSFTEKRRLKLWIMEFHKKFALPFGSVFFAFLAFSIAFVFGKHRGQTICLFIGLVVCVLYWAMQIMGQLFVQRIGLDPFWCIWVPNFVIGFMAVAFLVVLLKK
jgi:lipopolysaccharide export system permease protein